MAARTFLAWQPPSPAPTASKPRASAPNEVIDLSDDDSGTSSDGRSGAVAPVQRTASYEAQRKSSASLGRLSGVASSPAGSVSPLTSSRFGSQASSASSSPGLPPLAQALASAFRDTQCGTSVRSSSPAQVARGDALEPPDGHSGHSEDDFENIDSVLLAIAGGEAADRGAGTSDGGTAEDQHRDHVEAIGSQGLSKPNAHTASALADSDSDTDSSSDASQYEIWSDRQWPIRRICGVRTRRGKKLYLVRWADTEEPKEALGNARKLIAEFEHRRRARDSAQAKSRAPTYSGVQKRPKPKRV